MNQKTLQREFCIPLERIDKPARRDFLVELARPFHEIDKCEDFVGDGGDLVKCTIFSDHALSSCHFPQHLSTRTRRLVAQGGMDFYKINLVLAGTCKGTFDGEAVSARAGDIFLTDMAREYQVAASEGHMLSMIVGRERLELPAGLRTAHGFSLDGRRAITRLIKNYMIGIDAVSGDLPDHKGDAVLEALLALVLAGLRSGVPEEDVRSDICQVLRLRVLEFIDRNIHEPGLSATSIVAHFSVSRAHLYRAFAIDGGIARVIREKRLLLAYRKLSETRRKSSLKQVAKDLGFSSSGQLTRAFRGHFGISTGDVRLDRSTQMRIGWSAVGRLQDHLINVVDRYA